MTRVVGLLVLACLATSTIPAAQQPAAPSAQGSQGPGRGGGRGGFNVEPETIQLWDGPAPGALGTDDSDRPTLTLYRAGGRGGSGTAVVIAPGGAYAGLSMNNEGRQLAYWFNAMGVTAFVLKYRLGPRYHHPIEMGDAERAIRLVRSRAASLGFQPNRIGMMGFSAGGHLTATVGTRFDAGQTDAADSIDRVSSRPDFLILAYPVISFQREIAGENALGAYANSGRNLLGDNPSQALIDDVSAERHVTAETPPTFLFHTTNDNLVSVENSLVFYAALRKARVPAEMHVFENGAHGAGMGLSDPALSAWPTLLSTWLRGRGLLSAAGNRLN
jgi:acetyl esterase/lipase